jgi:hypothetical protein
VHAELTAAAPAATDLTYNVLLWSEIKKLLEFQLIHSRVMQRCEVFFIAAGG